MTIVEMRVVPVAGHDGMLMNLSGAHGPFFTRNVVLLRDAEGRTGLGEVPGGEKIRQTLEDARALQAAGVHQGRGWLFGRARAGLLLPSPEVVAWLREGARGGPTS